MYPAVTIRFTANGVTVTGTVDVMVIPEHVDVGGERIAGVEIQPEHIAEAFPTWSDRMVDYVRDVVAYAWNEGGVGTHDASWADFPAYDGTDAVGVLYAQYNDATVAACAVADDNSAEANARLIAAAPDLLSVLTEVETLLTALDAISGSAYARSTREALMNARAVIAQATLALKGV